MNVRCPQCQTVFRVDPEKVPVAGIRARCARCAAIFALSRSGVAARPAANAGATQATTAAPPEPALSPAAATTAGASQATMPAAPQAPAAAAPPPPAPPPPRPAAPAAPAIRPLPPQQPPPQPAAPATPSSTEPPKRPSFMKQDPNTRAQRLARALVSDILAYNKDKLKEAQAAGTVKNEFRDEIRKSWEEYVAQVGLDLARSTPFFRDALNEILGKGQQIF